MLFRVDSEDRIGVIALPSYFSGDKSYEYTASEHYSSINIVSSLWHVVECLWLAVDNKTDSRSCRVSERGGDAQPFTAARVKQIVEKFS